MVGWFFKRKREEKQLKVEKVEATDLDKICGDDKEVCKALWHTMFYDPRKINTTLEKAAKKAIEFEKKGESGQARVWYHIAGGLALWKGDVAKVKEYFSKCAEMAPDMGYELITKVTDRAVAKAQEFYKEFLK